ncbi:uncharacterized protein LODBEIA_P27980 [Lodderomyces beijingensis]|uniref:Uncharacterized protein n=1 Tax=Lodderomyces beijingensis TaxID=1775926 RepID=A0ABP0ZK96_9ASCO
MLKQLTARGRLTRSAFVSRRFNSSKDKFSDIEKFNKSKTQYNFDYNFDNIDKDKATLQPNSNATHPSWANRRDTQQQDSSNSNAGIPKQNDEILDVNAILENDPRLADLRPGSHEYRETLHKIHQEFLVNQEKAQRSYEAKERWKGVFYGFIGVVGLLIAHQTFMNYESIKNRATWKWYYGDMEDTVEDMSGKNVKASKHLAEKLDKEFSKENLANMKDSKHESGVYYFGDSTSKIPLRIKAFDGLYLKDALVEKGRVIAVTNNGKVYQWSKRDKKTTLSEIKLPSKIEKVVATKDYYYFLTDKGDVLYKPKHESTGFLPVLRRNWFGLLKSHDFDRLNAINIKEIRAGVDHILLLDKFGQVFVSNTSHAPSNHGQYGPNYSPFDNGKVPVNEVLDLALLNNEVVQTPDGKKSIEPRTFTSIASGAFFNIVADKSGNIWTWGDNTFGECGSLNTTKFQPVPKMVFGKADYKRICRNVFGTRTKEADFEVKKVAATADTSYIWVRYLNHDDVILSFGNGLDGQLGSGRYMQVCSYPEIIKSLTGLQEFDDALNRVKNIGIKDIAAGKNHTFITLDNAGAKDVLVTGSNSHGQFGNGKKIKACKPTQLPRLLEPQDGQDKNKLAKTINDMRTQRLQLLDDEKVGKQTVEQVIAAGDDASVIYYRCK